MPTEIQLYLFRRGATEPLVEHGATEPPAAGTAVGPPGNMSPTNQGEPHMQNTAKKVRPAVQCLEHPFRQAPAQQSLAALP